MDTKDGYIAFIINPKSGPSGSKLTARKFSQYLVEKGFAVKKMLTKSLHNACELAEDAGRDPDCALAVVVGGDGTVSEVAMGLEGSETPLIIVPSGTENLLANELGFDERLRTLIKAFEDNSPKPLDLGCVNDRCFTSITGCGFDGRVVKLLSENREGNIDYFDYFWPLWRTYWNYDFPPMKVTVDGEQIFEGRCLVFVGNISRYAMGLEILKNADEKRRLRRWAARRLYL
ncbi:MAG: diacylglycerol/lipid kinase family protein [Planctomycetota bacterium]|jgi:diacylglycerol kinase family enzyme